MSGVFIKQAVVLKFSLSGSSDCCLGSQSEALTFWMSLVVFSGILWHSFWHSDRSAHSSGHQIPRHFLGAPSTNSNEVPDRAEHHELEIQTNYPRIDRLGILISSDKFLLRFHQPTGIKANKFHNRRLAADLFSSRTRWIISEMHRMRFTTNAVYRVLLIESCSSCPLMLFI